MTTTYGLHVIMQWTDKQANVEAMPVAIRYMQIEEDIEPNQFVVCGDQGLSVSIINQIKSVYTQVEEYGGQAAMEGLMELIVG